MIFENYIYWHYIYLILEGVTLTTTNKTISTIFLHPFSSKRRTTTNNTAQRQTTHRLKHAPPTNTTNASLFFFAALCLRQSTNTTNKLTLLRRFENCAQPYLKSSSKIVLRSELTLLRRFENCAQIWIHSSPLRKSRSTRSELPLLRRFDLTFIVVFFFFSNSWIFVILVYSNFCSIPVVFVSFSWCCFM